VPFCRDGFGDVVLVDLAKPGAPLDEQVCSGVRLAPDWVLTAQHCVKDWTSTAGRIFVIPPGKASCLEGLDNPAQHPGAACGTEIRNGQPIEAPERQNGTKIDLALIPVKAAPGRRATVVRFDTSRPFEVTLGGFGRSPGGAPGRLRVGWSRIVAQRALAAMTTETATDAEGEPLDSVPIEFGTVDYGNDRLSSWICGGDSGGPVFAGRIFGYANEPHQVAAIMVGSTFRSDRCSPAAPTQSGGDFHRVVSLLERPVREWLCRTTANVLPVCN